MLKPLNGNWIDLIIILILAYYGWEAFRYGFLYIVADFASFLGSLLISLRVYKFAATLLKSNFNLPGSFANAIGFIATSIVLEIALGYAFAYGITKLPKKIRESKYNKLLGLVPALGEGIILIAFLLTAIVALPVQPQIKRDVTQSKIGSFILKETSGVERAINQIFGGAIDDTLTWGQNFTD